MWCSWRVCTVDMWKGRPLMRNPLVLYHWDQVHQKEPEINTKLTAMVTDILEDQQQPALTSLLEKRRVTDKAIPVAPSKNGDGKKGGCKHAQNTNDQNRVKGKGDKRQRILNPPNRGQPSQKPEGSNKTGTSTAGRDDRLPFYSYTERSCLKDQTFDSA